MNRTIFVAGTDTEVGKTVVTAALLRQLRRDGINAAPMKPVQTGATKTLRELTAPDLEFQLKVAGMEASKEMQNLMCPYRYTPACSPHLAGREVQHYAEIEVIEQCAEQLHEHYDALLIEGSGGVLAPLNESETMLDLIEELDVPVLLVADIGLGTINHSVLSARVLQRAGVTVLGVLYNEAFPEDDDFVKSNNPQAVSRFGDVSNLGVVPHVPGLNAEDAATWDAIMEGVPGYSIVKKVMQG